MNLATISFSYLRARPLSTLLNIVLLALGIATITVLLLVTRQLEERMMRDAQGIDLVIGAKGSPLQIILSSIYHLDVPTGNIPYLAAEELRKHRAVKQVIPLALGDSYRGFRIVGSTPAYAALYRAAPVSGTMFGKPLEAVVGSDVAAATGLAVGATFSGSHGLADGGSEHESHPYRVVGILARTGSVIDRVVLTSIESVWAVHGEHHGITDVEHIAEAMHDEDKEYTALLVQYASPLAAAILPRYVNANSQMQSASPAYETARLFSVIGIGVEVLRAFALVLVVAAGLSVFIGLYNALEERRYDLAVMRTLGAGRTRIMAMMIFEGLLLAVTGAVIGILLGHVFTEMLGHALGAARRGSMSGLVFLPEEAWLFCLASATGIIAALLPAWRACRTDIAGTLARG